MNVATPLELLTEKEWSSQVYDLCRMLGWKRYHTYRSKRSPAGFPDETLVRDRVVFLELKTETGKLSQPQREWLIALYKAEVEAYIARPSDLEALAEVLTARPALPVLGLLGALGDSTRNELELPP